jgi:FeS assembly SUF system regulator
MLKLSKKADYGLIALKHLAKNFGRGAFSAADIAAVYCISAPLLAKVMQKLARHGIVVATHGASGGYALAKRPEEISALEAINAIDGPFSITSCVTSRGECDTHEHCTVREPLRRVNDRIVQVLGALTLSQMSDDSRASGIVELRA